MRKERAKRMRKTGDSDGVIIVIERSPELGFRQQRSAAAVGFADFPQRLPQILGFLAGNRVVHWHGGRFDELQAEFAQARQLMSDFSIWDFNGKAHNELNQRLRADKGKIRERSARRWQSSVVAELLRKHFFPLQHQLRQRVAGHGAG